MLAVLDDDTLKTVDAGISFLRMIAAFPQQFRTNSPPAGSNLYRHQSGLPNETATESPPLRSRVLGDFEKMLGENWEEKLDDFQARFQVQPS